MVCWPALALCLALTSAESTAREGDGADGRFDKRTSSHFVLFQDVDIDDRHGIRGSRRFEQDVLATLEAAYVQLDAFLGLRPRRPITVVVYDPVVFDQQFAGLFGFAAAGFYEGTIRVRGDVAVGPQLASTLYHELVHAAFDAEAPSLVLPAWLNEGMAEWFEARALGKRRLDRGEVAFLVGAAEGGGLFSLAQLSAPSFGGFGPGEARLAYLQSYAFVDFLARHHGERRLRDLCRELVRTGQLERVVRRIYRADLARLETRFVAEYGARGRG